MTTSPFVKFFAIVAAAGIAACAQRPEPPLLVRAKQNLRQAEVCEAKVLAPKDFAAAQKAVEEADAAFQGDDYDDVQKHTILIADARAEIALLMAQEARNQIRLQEIDAKKAEILKLSADSRELLKTQRDLLAKQSKELTDLEIEHARLRKELMAAIAEVAKIRETKRGLVVSVSNILFEFNRADLKPGAQNNLLKIQKLLAEYPDRGILVEGHTDAVGSDEYNQGLSEIRAKAVRDFFVNNGFSPEHLTAKGYGKKYPLATNDTPEGRQQNRRVDIVILNANQQPEGNSPAADNG